MRIAIISDTHSYLDNKIWKYLEEVDEIWHAGDVGKVEVLDELSKKKPVYGVYGNIDDHVVRKELPEFTVLEREGLRIALTHIAGKFEVYHRRVAEWLREEKPDILVCGHSHILKAMYDKKFNLLHLNPGACGIHGFHQKKTFLMLEIAAGKINSLNVVELGPRAKI